MAWTNWSLLATPDEWFCGDLTYSGASCYELGTGGPRGGSIQIHYVGETANEKSRLSCYGRSGCHLAKMAVPSKKEAVQLQNNLLAKNRYDWNYMLNGD